MEYVQHQHSLNANREQPGTSAAELSDDDLEMVVGGLARTWTDIPTVTTMSSTAREAIRESAQ